VCVCVHMYIPTYVMCVSCICMHMLMCVCTYVYLSVYVCLCMLERMNEQTWMDGWMNSLINVTFCAMDINVYYCRTLLVW
jgi:hypothetical protein